MKTATVREVQHSFRSLLSLISEGETVEVTRNRRVVARIVPPPVSKSRRIKMPDFVSRMRREYPHRPVDDRRAADLISEMRGDR